MSDIETPPEAETDQRRALMRRGAMTNRERKAMREAKELARRGQTMGIRKIVSMQGCEKAGLVRRIERNGMIVDWDLTPDGERWTG